MKSVRYIALSAVLLLVSGISLYVVSLRMAISVARKNDIEIASGTPPALHSGDGEVREEWQPRELFSEADAIKACELIRNRQNSDLAGMIKQGLNSDLSGVSGVSLLHWAFVCNNLEAFELLLGAGADPDRKIQKSLKCPNKAVRIFQGDSVLFTSLRASGRDRWRFFFLGLKHSKQLQQRDNTMATLLHVCMGPDAVYEITPDQLDQVLASGIDVNAQDENGSTAPMRAVASDRPEFALRMLVAGADSDVLDAKGKSLADRLAICKLRAESRMDQAVLESVAKLDAFLRAKK